MLAKLTEMQAGGEKEFGDRLREYRRSKDTPNLLCRICEQSMSLNKYMVTHCER